MIGQRGYLIFRLSFFPLIYLQLILNPFDSSHFVNVILLDPCQIGVDLVLFTLQSLDVFLSRRHFFFEFLATFSDLLIFRFNILQFPDLLDKAQGMIPLFSRIHGV